MPVLVMRDTTERPEGVNAGTLKLVGTNEETIYSTFKLLLENKAEYDKMSHVCNLTKNTKFRCFLLPTANFLSSFVFRLSPKILSLRP